MSKKQRQTKPQQAYVLYFDVPELDHRIFIARYNFSKDGPDEISISTISFVRDKAAAHPYSAEKAIELFNLFRKAIPTLRIAAYEDA